MVGFKCVAIIGSILVASCSARPVVTRLPPQQLTHRALHTDAYSYKGEPKYKYVPEYKHSSKYKHEPKNKHGSKYKHESKYKHAPKYKHEPKPYKPEPKYNHAPKYKNEATYKGEFKYNHELKHDTKPTVPYDTPVKNDDCCVGPNSVIPPHCLIFGMTRDELMYDYWYLGLTGGSQTVGNVHLLHHTPMSSDGIIHVELCKNQWFFLPFISGLGERDQDPDTPADAKEMYANIFFRNNTETFTQAKLDGKMIINSETEDISAYTVVSEDFKPEIPIADAPNERGAVANLWAIGLGFVHSNLTPGVHTMTLLYNGGSVVDNYETFDTWQFTVTDCIC